MAAEKATENVEEGYGEFEGRIHANYLLSATNYLKGIQSNALRSHWSFLLSDIMNIKHLRVSEPLNKYPICQYCQIPWRYGDYSVKVMPKRKMKKKLRKIVRKVEQQKELSKFQKRLAHAIHTGPTVIVNCKICNKSSKIKVPQNKSIVSVTEETEHMNEVKLLNQKINKLRKKNKRKSKRKKVRKREKKAAGLDPVRSAQLDDTKENSKTVQDENKINNNNDNDDDDSDVVIIDKNLEVSQRTKRNSKKRKLNDDDVIVILNPEPEKPKKVRQEDAANSLPKTPFVVQSKQLPQCSTKKNNCILLNNFNSPSKRNILSKIGFTNEVKQKKNNIKSDLQRKQYEKKKNLTRWKRLIADEEKKPTKTSSLQDFLSAL